MKGKFIVLEGPDGSGKTTVAKGLVDHYKKQGIEIIHTREPGGTEIGEKIRDLVLDPGNQEMHPRTEALLYAASRAQHVEEKIRPALKRGAIILCERYVFSSLVYQGMSRNLGLDNVEKINDFATLDLKPDLIFYLDPKEALTRDRIVDRPLDRLEKEEAFTQIVQDNYRILAQKMRQDLIFIDASQGPDQVLSQCIQEIEREKIV